MKVLLVGGGAREHALAKALRRTRGVRLLSVMKNKNPGIEALADEVRLHDEADPKAVVEFARAKGVDLVVIGPEAPLAAGVADALDIAGIRVAAPTQAAAAIETDKAFMRALLDRHKISGNVPATAFTEAAGAKKFLKKNGPRFALKPVGLTGGKGVRVYGDHFKDVSGAGAYVDEVFSKRIGGGRLLIEELLEGEEFTLQAFTDGARVAPMVAVQDHKRLREGDQGPNTGGMGSFSQADGLLPFLTRRDWEKSLEILQKIVGALQRDGRTYRGPIYGQFMLTAKGPRVIEINARFGDPEAINALALLEADLSEVFGSLAEGNLNPSRVAFRQAATVVKYVVPKGYGTDRVAETDIRIDEKAMAAAGADVFYASVNRTAPGVVRTTKSRALAILGVGETLHEANDACEEGLRHVKGKDIVVRHDIGTKELIERRLAHMRLLRLA